MSLNQLKGKLGAQTQCQLFKTQPNLLEYDSIKNLTYSHCKPFLVKNFHSNVLNPTEWEIRRRDPMSSFFKQLIQNSEIF